MGAEKNVKKLHDYYYYYLTFNVSGSQLWTERRTLGRAPGVFLKKGIKEIVV